MCHLNDMYKLIQYQGSSEFSVVTYSDADNLLEFTKAALKNVDVLSINTSVGSLRHRGSHSRLFVALLPDYVSTRCILEKPIHRQIVCIIIINSSLVVVPAS